VILSGGLQDDDRVLAAYAETGAAAVMLARGALGNPWLFSRVLGAREDEPTVDEVLAELDWVMDRAVEHLGAERAGRYLRKFYPWYLERLGAGREQQEAFQAAASIDDARALVRALEPSPVPA
jgi:tRNA-dihydrouridine synthase